MVDHLHSLLLRQQAQSGHGDRLCVQTTLSLQLQGSSRLCGKKGRIKLSRQRRIRWLLPGMTWVSATSRQRQYLSMSMAPVCFKCVHVTIDTSAMGPHTAPVIHLDPASAPACMGSGHTDLELNPTHVFPRHHIRFIWCCLRRFAGKHPWPRPLHACMAGLPWAHLMCVQCDKTRASLMSTGLVTEVVREA